MKQEVMGIQFDNCTMEEAVAQGCRLMEQPGSHYVVTPNAEMVYVSRQQPELTRVLNGADLVLPDGIGVIYAGRILKTPLKEKVAGIDFGTAMLAQAAQRGWRVYLLGGKPGVAEQAAQNLTQKYPGLTIVGTGDGYFQQEEPVAQRIAQTGAQLVFVCLGVPKQEYWMAEHGHATGARLLMGLGGSLDIYAGISQRAPELWIRLGLEWAYRLVKEPWRIRRQMNLPRFLLCAIGMRLRGKG